MQYIFDGKDEKITMPVVEGRRLFFSGSPFKISDQRNQSDHPPVIITYRTTATDIKNHQVGVGMCDTNHTSVINLNT